MQRLKGGENFIQSMKIKISFAASGRILAPIFFAAALAFSSGCFLMVRNTGTEAYFFGELETSLANNVAKVDAATNQALQNLHFEKISEETSMVDASIKARTAQNRMLRIQIDRIAGDHARVRIRVDALGDETLSRSFLANIKAILDLSQNQSAPAA